MAYNGIVKVKETDIILLVLYIVRERYTDVVNLKFRDSRSENSKERFWPLRF